MSASKPAVYYGPIDLVGKMYFLDHPATEGQSTPRQEMIALDLDCDLPFGEGQRLKRLVIEFPGKGKDGKVMFHAERTGGAEIKVGAVGVSSWASLVPNYILAEAVPSKPETTTLKGEKVEEPADESDQTGHERPPDCPTPLGHGVQRE